MRHLLLTVAIFILIKLYRQVKWEKCTSVSPCSIFIKNAKIQPTHTPSFINGYCLLVNFDFSCMLFTWCFTGYTPFRNLFPPKLEGFIVANTMHRYFNKSSLIYFIKSNCDFLSDLNYIWTVDTTKKVSFLLTLIKTNIIRPIVIFFKIFYSKKVTTSKR